jgi:hypothetical protein
LSRKRLSSHRALSTVVTTLIILVVSVLLSGTITYFAINVTSTRSQGENILMSKQHLWYDALSSRSQAALLVVNAGGRDVVIDKITVRGQNVPWHSVSYYSGSFEMTDDLPPLYAIGEGCPTPIPNGLGSYYDFSVATKELALTSGNSIIIYIDEPDSINVDDVGLTLSFSIFTAQAMYYKETNVQGTIFAPL